MKQNFKKGFTLIELLVVIAIIGILAAITVVSVQGPRNKANDTKDLANMRQIASVLEQYAGDNGSYNTTTAIVLSYTGAGSLSNLLQPYGTPLPSNNGYMPFVAGNGASYCIYKLSLVNPANFIVCSAGANCASKPIGSVVTSTGQCVVS